MTDHLTDCDGNGSVTCWSCGGEGAWHDCGDDCCPHLNPEPDRKCRECEGTGEIRCPACAEQIPDEPDPVEFQRQNARAYRAKAMGERR